MKRVDEKKKRFDELMTFYKPLSDEKMALAKPLIENAVFVEFQLRDLQKEIEEQGTVDDYQNGNNQFGKKASASVQSYNSLVKSYNMISTRLEALMPKQSTKSKIDEFLNEK